MFQIDPLYLIATTAVLGLLPFLIMMTTSYVKIIVVLNLVRNALGVQQIPPTIVINGLALALSIFIMAPVALDTADLAKQIPAPKSGITEIMDAVDKLSPPIRQFLTKNTSESATNMFMTTARRIWPERLHDSIRRDNLLIMIPAFTISELTKAFQVGFVLYLAFIAIDLIISNILLAMGMMMVSPTTISLPFKLLLFVTLDGWLKLSQGLLLSYK